MQKHLLFFLFISLLFFDTGQNSLYIEGNKNRTISSSGETHFATSKTVVDYSRTSVRERVVFGTKEEGALQSYGVYWRLVANEYTEAVGEINFDFADTRIAVPFQVV